MSRARGVSSTRGRVVLTLAMGRSVLPFQTRQYQVVAGVRQGLEILDRRRCRPYDRPAEKPRRPGFPEGTREGVTNVSSLFQLPRGHRFLDRWVGPVPASAGNRPGRRSQRHLPPLAASVSPRSVRPATCRPWFLSTYNPTVNQGRAAIGNQRRRGLAGQRIDWFRPRPADQEPADPA